MKNYCYIDGQNLHLGTAGIEPAWHVDLHMFRVYLRENIKLKRHFTILVFRQHNAAMISKKKGNVDSDIIFSVMKRIQKDRGFDKILLVSGDATIKC